MDVIRGVYMHRINLQRVNVELRFPLSFISNTVVSIKTNCTDKN